MLSSTENPTPNRPGRSGSPPPPDPATRMDAPTHRGDPPRTAQPAAPPSQPPSSAPREDGPPPAAGPRVDAPPGAGSRVDGPPPGGGPRVDAPPRATAWHVDGPPPPPTPPRIPADDATPRSAAATWVAATGALLLLVAAGTFLAVSWDVLGMTARVAVVASVTAAAIVGGHRLRRVLPAVGAVLFHLGALLLPVDAIGLALQLDLSVAAAWILTGVVTLVALPPLAVAGRSRVLAAAAIVGVPVLATGLGLAGTADPALVVAAAGAVALFTLRLRGTRVARVWRTSPAALATTSVLLPLVAVVLDASLARGQVVAAVRAAGWAPTSWMLPTIVGVLAVGTVAVNARLARSRRLAALAPVVGAVAAMVAVLPAGTPRLALLLAAPVALLLVEVVAMIADDDPSWGEALRILAMTAEVTAGLAAIAVAQLVVAPDVLVGGAADVELAAALGVAAVAFGAGVLRRLLPRGPLGGAAVALGGAVVLHAVAAMTVAIPVGRTPLTSAVLMAVVGLGLVPAAVSRGSLGMSGSMLGTSGSMGTSRSVHPARAAVMTALALVAIGASWDTPAALPVAVLAAPLIGLHLRSLLVEGRHLAVESTAIAAPLIALAGLLLAALPGDLGIPSAILEAGVLQTAVLQVAVAIVALLGLAVTIDRVPAVADVIRGLATLTLLVAIGARWVPFSLSSGITADGQLAAIEFLRPVPALLVVLGPAVVWLVLDTVRLERIAIAVMSGLVVVRLTATVATGFGVGPVVLGAVLLGLALVAVIIAVTIRTAALRVGMAVVAVASALPGWALIGVTPEARAIALTALGLTGVAVGVARRNLVVGHLGGAIATIGIWLLLDLRGVTAIDVWVLPVAIQLAIAGMRARRTGAASSWAVDVPPLLLVAVPAVGERLTGGSGYHALLAGAVALVAVIYGGATGRGGPLTSGIVVVLAVVAVETVAYAALVPTWAWFAVAGSVLLGAAVLIERHGLSPSRAVDRLKHLAGDEPSARGRRAPTA